MYADTYVITNRCIDSVQCAVSAIDIDNNFVQMVFIRKEGGRINTDFSETFT